MSTKQVKWTLSPDFLKEILRSLKEDSNEIAGKIMFSDRNCKNGVCDKFSTDSKIRQGNGSSVYTPLGIINFHTHPNSIYKREKTKYGWPSGEDMGQCLRFFDKGTVVHIVFTMEGAYIISLENKIPPRHYKYVEDIFKFTHNFRILNQKTALKNFKEFLSPIYKTNKKNTVDMWLEMANKMTLNKLYKLSKEYLDYTGKIPSDNKKIFNVKLIKYSKNMRFSARYVTLSNHKKFFGKAL